MRKIELQMLQAIHERRDWRANNTAVRHCGDVAVVFLHGNRIAMVEEYDVDPKDVAVVFLHGNRIAMVNDGIVYPDDLTFHQFPTRTTVSRLKALGIRAKADCGSGTAALYDESARLPAPDAIR